MRRKNTIEISSICSNESSILPSCKIELWNQATQNEVKFSVIDLKDFVGILFLNYQLDFIKH